MRCQKFSCRLYVHTIKLDELHVFSKNPLHPSEAPPFEGNGVDVAVISEIPIVDRRTAAIVGMVFRKFKMFYDRHNYGREDNFCGKYRDKMKFSICFSINPRCIRLSWLQKTPCNEKLMEAGFFSVSPPWRVASIATVSNPIRFNQKLKHATHKGWCVFNFKWLHTLKEVKKAFMENEVGFLVVL